MKNFNAMEMMINGVNNYKMEKAAKIAEAAAKINDIGNVLNDVEKESLYWTIDTHIGNIIGHYYADEASLVGMTTWAGELIMAIRTAEDVKKIINPDFLKKKGRTHKAYESQFTDEDIAILEGCRGLKTKAVVVKGEEVAKKILDALETWDIDNATNEEVFLFVLDMTRMIRSCQEIEIDITKDKSLVRFMELVAMIAPGAYILSNKFKTRAKGLNPGLVTNIKELRGVDITNPQLNKNDLKFKLSIGHLNYVVGTNTSDEEDFSVIGECQDVVKTINKAMVNDGVVDCASVFQEELMDKTVPLLGRILEVAKMSDIDFVISETRDMINTGAIDSKLIDLAKEMAPVTKAVGDYDRILNISNADDKKGKIKHMSDILRNTYRRLHSAHNSAYSVMTKEKLEAQGYDFKEMFSRLVVASELCKYNAEKHDFDFDSKHALTTINKYCRAEYLTLAVDENLNEFISGEHKAYGVHENTEDGEVKVVGRNIVKDGEIVGRLITDKLNREVDGRKFYLEKRDEEFILVEKMSIQAMRMFPSIEDVLVTIDLVEYGEYTKEKLSFGKENITQSKLDLREAYIQELRMDLTSDEVNLMFDYNKNAFVDVYEDGEIVMPLGKNSETWRNMLQRLYTKANLTPAQNKEYKKNAAKERIPYIVKDAFLTGNKIALVVCPR